MQHLCADHLHAHKLVNMRRDGREFIEIHQVGDDFEECVQFAKKYSEENDMPILKSFETLTLLNGYATIAKEIVDARTKKGGIDYVMVPAGGGGLVSSISSVIKQISPRPRSSLSSQREANLIVTPFSRAPW